MELDTLTVDPAEAEAKVAEYEAMIAADRTAEDRAILQAYRAARRGLPIIRLSRSVAAGGFFDSGLPKIAVINADAAQCYVHWDQQDLIYTTRNDPFANRGAMVGRSSVRVHVDDPPSRLFGSRWNRHATMVPIVPPKVRPRPRRLAHCHLLWEVESWAMVPPKDPALLKHIRGDLWLVLATWDLTDLERYVLGERHG